MKKIILALGIVVGGFTNALALDIRGGMTATLNYILCGAENFLSLDAGTLYVDCATNMVGINDSTPQYPLDITGAARTTGQIIVQSSATVQGPGGVSVTYGVAAATVAVGGAAPSSLGSIFSAKVGSNYNLVARYNGQLDLLSINDAGNAYSKMQIAANPLILSGGTVSIGSDLTPSATNTLQVNGALGVNAGAYFGSDIGVKGAQVTGKALTVHTGAGTDGIQVCSDSVSCLINRGLEMNFATSGAGAYIYNRENGLMEFATNNTPRLHIQAAGNVGIGNTAPIQKLDVTGNITNSGVIHSSGTGASYMGGNLGLGITEAVRRLQLYGTPGNVDAAFTDSTTGGTTGDGFQIQMRSASSKTYLANLENYAMEFDTNNLERMQIAAGGDITFGPTGGAYRSTWTASTGGLALAGTLGVSGVTAGRALSVGGAIQTCTTASCTASDGAYFSDDGTDVSIVHQRVGNMKLATRNDLSQGLQIQTLGSGNGNAQIVTFPNAVGASTFTATGFSSGGFLGAKSKTAAQLEAITPTAAGQIYYCSDCSNSVHVVVSTGSAVCQFDSFTGGVAWH